MPACLVAISRSWAIWHLHQLWQSLEKSLYPEALDIEFDEHPPKSEAAAQPMWHSAPGDRAQLTALMHHSVVGQSQGLCLCVGLRDVPIPRIQGVRFKISV